MILWVGLTGAPMAVNALFQVRHARAVCGEVHVRLAELGNLTHDMFSSFAAALHDSLLGFW